MMRLKSGKTAVHSIRSVNGTAIKIAPTKTDGFCYCRSLQ